MFLMIFPLLPMDAVMSRVRVSLSVDIKRMSGLFFRHYSDFRSDFGSARDHVVIRRSVVSAEAPM